MSPVPNQYKGNPLRCFWPWLGLHGELLGYTARYDRPNEKKDVIPFFVKNGNGFEIGALPAPRPLFGLDLLAKLDNRRAVFIVEGEKCAAALRSMGLIAITSLGGASQSSQADWTALRNATAIYILSDNDEAGWKYGKEVHEILLSICLDATIIEIKLPNLPVGGDVCDWIAKRVSNWDQFEPVPESACPIILKELHDLIKTQSQRFLENRSAIQDLARAEILNIQNSNWPDLIPLQRVMEREKPYPIDAFPKGIREAILRYRDYAQQPLSLIAGSALANLSLVCQGVVDVARDQRLIGPCSLYILVVAESGERKSAADTEFGNAIREWSEDESYRLRDKVQESQAEQIAWKAQCEGIESKIKQLSGKKPKDQEGMSLSELKDQLKQLKRTPPTKVLSPSLFHETVTQEKLAESIAEGWPSSSIWTDEGGLIVGSNGMNKENIMKFLTLLNRLWDGKEYRNETKSSGELVLSHRRFTCSIMLQEVVLKQLLLSNDGISRGTGFLARMLIAYPETTMGKRFYREPSSDLEAIASFHYRLKEMLNFGVQVDNFGRLFPVVLQLNSGAKDCWVQYHDLAEQELNPLGSLVEVKDFASKSAENAARIAACFHVYENGPEGEIPADTMDRAKQVAQWYLQEARRVFSIMQKPQDITDAELLIQWVKKNGLEVFPIGEILHSGPNKLRSKDRRDKVLSVLVEFGYVQQDMAIKRKQIIVNPKVFK